MEEQTILQRLCLDATRAGATGEVCCRLCDTLFKAVDRHQVQANGGSNVSIKVLI